MGLVFLIIYMISVVGCIVYAIRGKSMYRGLVIVFPAFPWYGCFPKLIISDYLYICGNRGGHH
jgi:hypothetical protein